MKLPKWAQNAKTETSEIYEGSAEYVIEQLQDLPKDAYIEAELLDDSYYGNGAYSHIAARWQRDMTETEYLTAKLERKKRRDADKAYERAELDRLAEKLGVDISER